MVPAPSRRTKVTDMGGGGVTEEGDVKHQESCRSPMCTAAFVAPLPTPVLRPTDGNFGAVGGPMGPATLAWQLLRGSPWALEYLHCHRMMTQTHPKAVGGSLKKNDSFRPFSSAMQQPNTACAPKAPTTQAKNPHCRGPENLFCMRIEKV